MIDEKVLLEAIRKRIRAFGDEILDYVEWLIEEQPKVGEWIPCSERLPDNNENVLVWCEGYFQPWIGWYGDIKRSWFVIDYDGECEKYKVIAWMPLPPAYKGE